MKQSELFTKARREVPKDEEATNAKLLIRAGFVDKTMAGVYSFLPLGLRVLKNIEGIIRSEMLKIGGQEVLLPALQPSSSWKLTGRAESYDTLFIFESHYSKNEYVLGPTHEEIISPLMKRFVSSYKDLPFAAFQIQTKFRDEKRAKSGLLRGREFMMKDLYSFHADDEDLDRYYEKVKAAYKKIFNAAGLGASTYLTFASGGTFSKYSHEFQTVSEAGEDTIYLCEKCKVAVNKEIIGEQRSCPQCGTKDLNEKTAIEVGNIFKLKTKYSKPFGLTYKDKDGSMKDVVMGCYGIGLTRLMATIAEVYHDERGLMWPARISPFHVHLIELNGASATSFYRDLQGKGISVLYDDRKVSAGEKFAEADLIGVPLRLVVSPQTGTKVEAKRRNEKQPRPLSVSQARALAQSFTE
jgi:prolyl-tRNA synthetase